MYMRVERSSKQRTLYMPVVTKQLPTACINLWVPGSARQSCTQCLLNAAMTRHSCKHAYCRAVFVHYSITRITLKHAATNSMPSCLH
eukprot:14964-Heterococcus_DN1.PRE.2